jgi:thiamine-monophosphate kinase
MSGKKDQEIKPTLLSEFGEFKLIDHLTKNIQIRNPSTLKGVGDDAAVFRHDAEKVSLVTSDMLIEGVHFNLRYVPLKHLGYKAAVVNFSDIYAMNGHPLQMVVSLAISSRYTVEAIEELYAGMIRACEIYGVDFVGGDTSSSPQGMQISVTVIGEASERTLCYRKGAKTNDLICVSGDLGAAYAGLLVLQREEKTFLVNPNHQPDLEPYDYVVQRQLKPEAGKNAIALLEQHQIVPTSMIDISDGLASELLHIAGQSNVGFKVFENQIPIDQQTYSVAEEFNLAPMTLALNGGEDYELLFTVDISKHDIIKTLPGITMIGHVTSDTDGKYLISNSGQAIELKAQGWVAF